MIVSQLAWSSGSKSPSLQDNSGGWQSLNCPLWQHTVSPENPFDSTRSPIPMTVHLEGKPHYILTATCDSRMGTVARVSGFLASRTCYITDMQQFDDVITGRFF